MAEAATQKQDESTLIEKKMLATQLVKIVVFIVSREMYTHTGKTIA